MNSSTQQETPIMSTQELLLAQLPMTSEVNLAVVIQEFAHSRTVDELYEATERMITNIDPATVGISPAGFKMVLFQAIDKSLEEAKTKFIREQYDDIEWQRMDAVLLRMHVPMYSYSDHSGPEFTDSSSDEELEFY